MRILPATIAFGLCVLMAKAEDWTTTDGRIYKDIRVVRHDAAYVIIHDSDGGAVIPLALLPPDLQKKFDYDPEKAAALAKVQAAKQQAFSRQIADMQRQQVILMKGLFDSALSSSPNKVILYSVEPLGQPRPGDKTLHNLKILRQTELDPTHAQLAAKAFQKAAEDWDGQGALCFNPRVALRIASGGHTYDFLLCYECEEVDFYKDEKAIGSAGASGSPQFLNDLLTAAHVPLPPTGSEAPEGATAERKKQDEDDARWLAAMPKSIQSSWDWPTARGSPGPDIALLRGLLTREFPQVRLESSSCWNGTVLEPGLGTELAPMKKHPASSC